MTEDAGQSPRAQKRRAIAFILGATLLWSIPSLAIKYLTTYMDLFTQNLVRFVAASAFLWIVCLAKIPRQVLAPSVLLRVLPAFAAVMIYQYVYTRAFYMRDLMPGLAYMLVKSTVFITAVLSCIFFADERRVVRDRRFLMGAGFSVLGLAGFAVAGMTGSAPAPQAPGAPGGTLMIGLLLILTSAFFWSLYTVPVKRLVRHGSPLVAYTYVCTLMTLVFAAMTLAEGKPHLEVPPGGKGVWMWTVAIASGALCVGAAHVMYYYAIRTLGATVCGTVSLSNTFLPPVLSLFIFGERLNPWGLAAGACLVAGAALTLRAEPVESEQ
jgi:drug/metabolite transporter (DMT)-like permease